MAHGRGRTNNGASYLDMSVPQRSADSDEYVERPTTHSNGEQGSLVAINPNWGESNLNSLAPQHSFDHLAASPYPTVSTLPDVPDYGLGANVNFWSRPQQPILTVSIHDYRR
jgi:hypothetical protein